MACENCQDKEEGALDYLRQCDQHQENNRQIREAIYKLAEDSTREEIAEVIVTIQKILKFPKHEYLMLDNFNGPF